MLASRSLRRTIVIASVVLSILSIERATRACSEPLPSVFRTGPLGFDIVQETVNGVVPSNFAVLDLPSFFQENDSGAPPEWRHIPEFGWWVPTVPFEPGRSFSFDGAVVTTSSVLDTTPPSAPAIVSATTHRGDDGGAGCGTPKCGGGISTYSIRILLATDDVAPARRITYEVFVGSTAASAQDATTPFGRLLPLGDVLFDTMLLARDTASFVAIRAIDQAGNVSPRSESVRVTR